MTKRRLERSVRRSPLMAIWLAVFHSACWSLFKGFAVADENNIGPRRKHQRQARKKLSYSGPEPGTGAPGNRAPQEGCTRNCR
jgi:hypothetical protein